MRTLLVSLLWQSDLVYQPTHEISKGGFKIQCLFSLSLSLFLSLSQINEENSMLGAAVLFLLSPVGRLGSNKIGSKLLAFKNYSATFLDQWIWLCYLWNKINIYMLGYKNLRKYPRKRLEGHNTTRVAELSGLWCME